MPPGAPLLPCKGSRRHPGLTMLPPLQADKTRANHTKAGMGPPAFQQGVSEKAQRCTEGPGKPRAPLAIPKHTRKATTHRMALRSSNSQTTTQTPEAALGEWRVPFGQLAGRTGPHTFPGGRLPANPSPLLGTHTLARWGEGRRLSAPSAGTTDSLRPTARARNSAAHRPAHPPPGQGPSTAPSPGTPRKRPDAGQ